MKERDDRVYLKHILDAIARIEGYLSGVNQETFIKTPLPSGANRAREMWEPDRAVP